MVEEIKGEFDELASNKQFTVEIDGKTLVLDLRADDLSPLVTMAGKEVPDEEDLDRLVGTLRKVLQRSYLPYWDNAKDVEPADLDEAEQKKNEDAKQKVEAILRDYYVDLIQGIVSELGWEDRTEGATLNRGKKSVES